MENLLHGVASDRVVVAHGLLELDKNDSVGVLTLAPRYTTIEEECQSKAGPATRLRYMTQRLCPMRRSERTRDGHRAATGYDHQLRDVVNLTVHNNGPLAVFAIVLNNRCHLRRFRFSLFDRGRIPAPIWTIVSA